MINFLERIFVTGKYWWVSVLIGSTIAALLIVGGLVLMIQAGEESNVGSDTESVCN